MLLPVSTKMHIGLSFKFIFIFWGVMSRCLYSRDRIDNHLFHCHYYCCCFQCYALFLTLTVFSLIGKLTQNGCSYCRNCMFYLLLGICNPYVDNPCHNTYTFYFSSFLVVNTVVVAVVSDVVVIAAVVVAVVVVSMFCCSFCLLHLFLQNYFLFATLVFPKFPMLLLL